MALSNAETPKNDIVNSEERLASVDLSFAPIRAGRIHITSFLHEDEEFVKRTFSLSDDRVGGFDFDKERRCVSLYNTERGMENDVLDPCLFLPEQDWSLFYKYVWTDLDKYRQDPRFVGEWRSVIPGIWYRMFADGCGASQDDSLYILCGFDSTLTAIDSDRASPGGEICFDLKFTFQWRDVPVLDSVFTDINKMFKWCKLRDRYNSVRVKLFTSEVDVEAVEF
ncbi:MAG: hypothetical protein ACRC7H_06085 [Plesiomonas shigelloides]